MTNTILYNMSEPVVDTAELSAEEKKRLLRERRQAKMSKGKATARLNNILSQGSSVKTSGVKSVLDQEKEATSSHDDDPEIQDITEITTPPPRTPPIGEDAPQDIDKIFQTMLQQQQQRGQGANTADDPFAQIMKMFNQTEGPDSLINEGSASTQDPTEIKYHQELLEYNTYNQKLWKFRFLLVRLLVTLFNFFYHYTSISDFHASNYAYVRDLSSEEYPVRDFFTWFATSEVVLVAAYYSVFHSLGLFHAANQNSIILKVMSMGSMILPQLESYKPLVARFLGYYELLGIVLGDLSLVIVLFGLLSFAN